MEYKYELILYKNNLIRFGSDKLYISEEHMYKIIEYINISINNYIESILIDNSDITLNNIIINNIKDIYLQKFDDLKFNIDNKIRNTFKLIDNHIYNIKNNKNDLISINIFLKIIKSARCVIDKIKYNSYYDFKVNNIKILIYIILIEKFNNIYVNN